MGETPRAAALIAPPSLALPYAPRLCAAFTTAVALPPVAVAAYQHFGLAARTGKHSATRARVSLDSITRRCNTSHALVVNTVGRGSRNNLPVIAAAAPVLQHGPSSTASSPRRPDASQASGDNAHSPARALVAPRGGWGEPPGQAFVLQDKPAAASLPNLNASRVLTGSPLHARCPRAMTACYLAPSIHRVRRTRPARTGSSMGQFR